MLVGNENILRWDGQKNLRDPNATSPAQLIREIRNVKRNVKVPVSTAEPWHVWLEYPELAREVDYLAVHILPYWDEKSGETPLEYLKSRIAKLKEAEYLRNKNIIVTEVGWPSNGAARRSPGSGVVKYATPAEQAKNVRDMQAVSDRAWVGGADVHEAHRPLETCRVVYFGGDCVERETPSFSRACDSL